MLPLRMFFTGGTADHLLAAGVETRRLPKISEGRRPNILDLIANGEIALIVNTPTRKGGHTDEGRIRAIAVTSGVPMITTASGARAAVLAITALQEGKWDVAAIQDYFPHLARAAVAEPAPSLATT